MFVLFDSTFDGLLSACAWCFRNRQRPIALISALDAQPLLQAEEVPCENNISRLFKRHLTHVLGSSAGSAVMDNVYRAFLSEQDDIATQIFNYLTLALETRRDPSARLYEPSVAAVAGAVRRVSSQAHAYLGLLRFRCVGSDFFVADFEPDCHVLPLILPHFCDRLPDQDFAIRDLRRHLAALHLSDGTTSIHILADCPTDQSDPGLVLPNPADLVVHDRFGPLWRGYLRQLTIPERCNAGLQRANMPKKYWRYLTEQIKDENEILKNENLRK